MNAEDGLRVFPEGEGAARRPHKIPIKIPRFADAKFDVTWLRCGRSSFTGNAERTGRLADVAAAECFVQRPFLRIRPRATTT